MMRSVSLERLAEASIASPSPISTHEREPTHGTTQTTPQDAQRVSDSSTLVQDPSIVEFGDDAESLLLPDGGWRAWLVVMGGFLDFVTAFGKSTLSPLTSDSVKQC